MAELLARIDALIRRAGSGGPSQDVLQVGDLRMDRGARRLTRSDAPISLSATEFRLVEYLMVNAGHVMSKSQIMDHLQGGLTSADGIDLMVARLEAETGRMRLLLDEMTLLARTDAGGAVRPDPDGCGRSGPRGGVRCRVVTPEQPEQPGPATEASAVTTAKAIGYGALASLVVLFVIAGFTGSARRPGKVTAT